MSPIQHKTQLSAEASVLLILGNTSLPSALNLPPEQVKFLQSELQKKDAKQVNLNYLGRYISILIIDEKKEVYQLKEQIRKHAATVADVVNQLKGESLEILCTSKNTLFALAAAEGAVLASYQFIKHKPSAKQKNTLKAVYVVGTGLNEKHILQTNCVIDATLKARDLVNEPVNHLNATDLANAFKALGKSAGFNVEIWNKAKIKQKKMGGLLSVNAGSVDEPTFSILSYKPKNAKNKKPYVLVGKGVVYDTGGLSLKPTPNSMDSMKCDMAGAAAVGCALYAIAKAKLPIHVIALVPATDNRPGFNAFAPGDIITMMDGSTVEMLNSDAEGRMILADALHVAKSYKPELTIDIATLTGAAAAAIGQYGIVGMGTATDKQKEALKQSGMNVYERIAEFPFWDEYDDLMKSDIADQKNIGGPYGGAITAGKFLAKFTDYPYFHLDIAGPSFLAGKDSYRGKGGTGVGVRLLFDFFANM
jgi:leucyl aminopeptidase